MKTMTLAVLALALSVAACAQTSRSREVLLADIKLAPQPVKQLKIRPPVFSETNTGEEWPYANTSGIYLLKNGSHILLPTQNIPLKQLSKGIGAVRFRAREPIMSTRNTNPVFMVHIVGGMPMAFAQLILISTDTPAEGLPITLENKGGEKKVLNTIPISVEPICGDVSKRTTCTSLHGLTENSFFEKSRVTDYYLVEPMIRNLQIGHYVFLYLPFDKESTLAQKIAHHAFFYLPFSKTSIKLQWWEIAVVSDEQASFK
jgi:hypothetical protein